MKYLKIHLKIYIWSHGYTHIVAYYTYSDVKSYFVTAYSQLTMHVSDAGSV